jgi:hypothetical protein
LKIFEQGGNAKTSNTPMQMAILAKVKVEQE